MLGARKGSTPLSYNLQPTAQYVYDPVARRAVRYVETIVPTLKDGSDIDTPVPADRLYCNLGAVAGSTTLPAWLGSSTSNATLRQWDSSSRKQYMRLSSAAAEAFVGNNGVARYLYPTGPFGEASSFAPKNVAVTRARMHWTARYNANADYGVYGIGAGTTIGFSDSAAHFIQITRNGSSWELGSCDGATISQSSGGTADGSWHEFRAEWSLTALELYVDDVLTITKATNMPTQPLLIAARAQDNTNTIDLADVLVDWEVA